MMTKLLLILSSTIFWHIDVRVESFQTKATSTKILSKDSHIWTRRPSLRVTTPSTTRRSIPPIHDWLGTGSNRRAGAISVFATTPRRPDAPTSTPVEWVESIDNNNDSLFKFSRDIEYVLYELRGLKFDPCIPKHLMGGASTLSYCKTWTLDDWEYHNSRWRYFRYLKNLPRSRLLRRIMPQQLVLLAWTFLCIYGSKNIVSWTQKIPLSALGTISSFVAFLLTLRCNQGLSRLDEARRLWSKVILNTREMGQLISAFVYPVDKQLALMLGRHVAIFGWLLKSQLRFTKNDEVADIVRTMLPDKKDADYLSSQRQKTVAVVTRIRQVISVLGKQHRLTTAEEMALDHTAHALSEAITSTGRIRASPIPTLYTSHASRLLMFYLLCLPASLSMSGLEDTVTVLLTMVVGFAMFGLDEISHLFEQPFRVIPMYQICKRSMVAVADCFTCRPPALSGEVRDEEADSLSQRDLTTYWSTKDMADMSDNVME